MCVCVHILPCTYGMHVEVRGQPPEGGPLIAPWDPGVELRSSGFHSKCFYPLSHLTKLYLLTFLYFHCKIFSSWNADFMPTLLLSIIFLVPGTVPNTWSAHWGLLNKWMDGWIQSKVFRIQLFSSTSIQVGTQWKLNKWLFAFKKKNQVLSHSLFLHKLLPQ